MTLLSSFIFTPVILPCHYSHGECVPVPQQECLLLWECGTVSCSSPNANLCTNMCMIDRMISGITRSVCMCVCLVVVGCPSLALPTAVNPALWLWHHKEAKTSPWGPREKSTFLSVCMHYVYSAFLFSVLIQIHAHAVSYVWPVKWSSRAVSEVEIWNSVAAETEIWNNFTLHPSPYCSLEAHVVNPF